MIAWGYWLYYGGRKLGRKTDKVLRVFPGEKRGMVEAYMRDATVCTENAARLVKLEITELHQRRQPDFRTMSEILKSNVTGESSGEGTTK